ncbi:MAG: geranylgeranyl diphosphate reductase [Pseudomonadota bacterium]|mgnify:CR=1 FL=1
MNHYDVIVVGGGPTGATAAHDLATAGRTVLLLDRRGRIKPCGGAVPPVLVREFNIPDSQLEAKVTDARMISPANEKVDMSVGGWVGMVDREVFDEWLRQRAADAGATRIDAMFQKVTSTDEGAIVRYRDNATGDTCEVRANYVIGADGARSRVARQCIPGADKIPHVFAYHEIVKSPERGTGDFEPTRCDVYYQGDVSPDFYGWVFPHGERTSIGMGTANQGYSLRAATSMLRDRAGLSGAETVRTEGAPIPLRPLKRWDNGRDVVVAGDAAGVVAPASGEGIYYAMCTGRFAAEAVSEALDTGDARALRLARKRFRKAHGRVFFILGILQKFWYSSDKRREKFVKICRDPDVQHLTWEAYMNKKLVRAKPVAHVRIFFKDLAHLVGLAPR